jgi:hypothetical protein
MSSVRESSPPATPGDDAAVVALGYVQRLDRSLSHFGLFSLQFSYAWPR